MYDLKGKVALITGVANSSSIAYGCAKELAEAGATIVMTYQNEKTAKYTQPLAEALGVELFLPLDVQDSSPEQVVKAIQEKYGKLHVLLHSMAFADKTDLHGNIVDCSEEGFVKAMLISCYSLIKLTKLVEPLMTEGGSIFTMSYLGADKAVQHYGIMGVVKAALESAVRYLAVELGEKDISVHAVSPGPLLTRAASGISHFDSLMETAIQRSPLHRLITIEEIGALVAFLSSDKGRRSMTGSLIYADCGYNIVG